MAPREARALGPFSPEEQIPKHDRLWGRRSRQALWSQRHGWHSGAIVGGLKMILSLSSQPSLS